MTNLHTPKKNGVPEPLNASANHLSATNNSTMLLSPGSSSMILGNSTSPSSPHSAKIAVRNQLLAAVDIVRSLLHQLRVGAVDHLAGLPPLSPHLIEECLDGVVEWIENTETYETISELDIRDAIVKLDDEMNSCGVTLYLEALTRIAREEYKVVLQDFCNWLQTTQHKTGNDQPLNEPERAIMTDFAEVEIRWADNEANIIASRQELEDRTLAMKEMRNTYAEELAQNESVRGIRENLSDGSVARRRQLFKHVANRAAMLRHVPKEHLSSRQRRDSRDTANAVMHWIDENKFEEGLLEELADHLQRVCETARVVSAAADNVARKNELDQLLSFIRSCITARPEIMESLGEDALQGLAFVVGKSEHWLEEHPNPSIAALEKFIEGLRLACRKYGLSCPAAEDAVVPPPSVVVGTSTKTVEHEKKAEDVVDNKTEAGAQQQAAPSSDRITGQNTHAVPEPTAEERAAAVAKVVVAKDPLLITHVACTILEELFVLRVACKAAGASSFIARHISPLQVEVEHVLQDELALVDGAAALLRRYRAVLKAASDAKLRVPSSCWTHVLPFDDVELAD